MTKKQEYKHLQQTAQAIASKSVCILASEEKKFVISKKKDILDVATSADLKVERYIRSVIRKKYPTHSILGEEFGEQIHGSTYEWIIDPLDGTKEYVRGAGEYGCLLAVEENGNIVVGIAQKVGHSEVYSCSKGNGAFCNDAPISVSQTSALFESYIGFHLPASKHDKKIIDMSIKVLQFLISTCYRVRPGWHDAFTAAWVAKGILDACVITIPVKWYDIAPSLLLVEEAGGKVTDLSGKRISSHTIDNGLLISNGKLHDLLVQSIQPMM